MAFDARVEGVGLILEEPITEVPTPQRFDAMGTHWE